MNIISFILFIVLLFFLYIRYLEKTTVFYPDPDLEQDPSTVGLTFEDLTITTSDGEILHGWWVPGQPESYTVLFFHGNAGNISHRLEKIKFFHEMGFQVLILDYRGYGKSSGSPTEQGVFTDAEAAYTFLRTHYQIPEDKIIVYGASLGGAIAIDLAAKQAIAGLIVDSTFSSAKDMARYAFPWAPTIFMSVKFDSINKIKHVNAPVLIFHSTDDVTVPFDLGKKLFDAASEPKTFVTTVGGHNDEHVYSRELFEQNLSVFLHALSASHE